MASSNFQRPLPLSLPQYPGTYSQFCVIASLLKYGVMIRGRGVKSHLFFFLHFLYVVELSFLVSKSAYLSPNSCWFRFYRHLKVGRWSENGLKIGQKYSV